MEGGLIMYWKGRKGLNIIGIISIALGILILLAILLPSGFWWIVLAIALIVGGILALRAC
jgi:fatty acid desaturase